MAQNYIYSGDQIELVLTADATSGVPVLIGTKLVVPLHSGKTGETIVVKTNGVWRLPKATGAGWTIGAAIYWDDTAKKCTTTSAGNTLVGYAVAVSASADTEGLVKLNG